MYSERRFYRAASFAPDLESRHGTPGRRCQPRNERRRRSHRVICTVRKTSAVAEVWCGDVRLSMSACSGRVFRSARKISDASAGSRAAHRDRAARGCCRSRLPRLPAARLRPAVKAVMADCASAAVAAAPSRS